MYPSKLNWHMVVLQTNIFKVFPGSIKISSVLKFYQRTVCNRYIFDYILNRDLWLNRPYFEISNSNKRDCQTIDCRNFNLIGSSKYRTSAESDKPQICYYNRNRKRKVIQ